MSYTYLSVHLGVEALMKIIVSGKNIETGDSLKQHVDTAIQHIVDKYFGDILEVHVSFSKDGFRFITEISFHRWDITRQTIWLYLTMLKMML